MKRIEQHIYYREDPKLFEFRLRKNGILFCKSSKNIRIVLEERDRIMRLLRIDPFVLYKAVAYRNEIKLSLVTLEEAFIYWIEREKKDSISDAAYAHYLKALRAASSLSSKRLITIKTRDWNNLWRDSLKKKKLSYSYVYKQFNAFYGMYEYFISKGYMEHNVLDESYIKKLKPVGQVRQKKRVFDDEEKTIFLNTCKEFGETWYNFFKLIFLTGMRRGETLALKWADIDFQNGLINVQRTITKGIKDKVYYEYESPTTKGKNDRTIPVDKQFLSELLELKRDRKDKDYVFHLPAIYRESKYKWIDLAMPNRIFRRVIDKAGLDKALTIHSIRHYVCSTLEAAGVSRATLKAIGGWSSEKMIDRVYSHGTLTKMREALELLK